VPSCIGHNLLIFGTSCNGISISFIGSMISSNVNVLYKVKFLKLIIECTM